MKSVLFISASPHKRGKSLRIIQEIIDNPGFQADNIQILIPHQYLIKPCTGCEYCRIHKRCVINDDEFPRLHTMFKDFTHIITVSPIYFYHLPGPFKVIIDRFQPYYHINNTNPNTYKGMAVLYGASKGKKLFDGSRLTLKYFLETVNTNLESCFNMTGISEWNDLLPNLPDLFKTVNEF